MTMMMVMILMMVMMMIMMTRALPHPGGDDGGDDDNGDYDYDDDEDCDNEAKDLGNLVVFSISLDRDQILPISCSLLAEQLILCSPIRNGVFVI